MRTAIMANTANEQDIEYDLHFVYSKRNSSDALGSSTDSWVRYVTDALEKEPYNLKCYFDARDMVAGQLELAARTQAMAKSKRIAIVLSGAATVDSDFDFDVAMAVKYHNDHGKGIIPVRIENATPNIASLDAFCKVDAVYQPLARVLEQLAGRQCLQSTGSTVSTTSSRSAIEGSTSSLSGLDTPMINFYGQVHIHLHDIPTPTQSQSIGNFFTSCTEKVIELLRKVFIGERTDREIRDVEVGSIHFKLLFHSEETRRIFEEEWQCGVLLTQLREGFAAIGYENRIEMKVSPVEQDPFVSPVLGPAIAKVQPSTRERTLVSNRKRPGPSILQSTSDSKTARVGPMGAHALHLDPSNSKIAKTDGDQNTVSRPASSLPDLSPVVRTPDLSFTGREVDLDKINKFFERGRQVGNLGSVMVLLGQSAVGKTQVAAMYAQKYQANYPGGVVWLIADTRARLNNCVNLQMSYFNVANKRNSTALLRCKALINHFQKQDHKWLLVLDDVEDVDLVKNYFPRSPEGAEILIVSSAKKWKPDTKIWKTYPELHEVGPLLPENAEIFLARSYQPFIEQEKASEVFTDSQILAPSVAKQKLEGLSTEERIPFKFLIGKDGFFGLPLALWLASCFMRKEEISIHDYMEKLIDFCSTESLPVDEHERAMKIACNISMESLEKSEEGKAALQLLYLLTAFERNVDTETIKKGLEFLCSLPNQSFPLKVYLDAGNTVESLLEILDQFALSRIHKMEGCFMWVDTHSLVRRTVQERLQKDSDNFRLVIYNIIRIFKGLMPNTERVVKENYLDYDKNKKEDLHRIITHVVAFGVYIHKWIKVAKDNCIGQLSTVPNNINLVSLLTAVGVYQKQDGNSADSVFFFQLVETLTEGLYPGAKALQAYAKRNLAAALFEQEKLKEALGKEQESLLLLRSVQNTIESNEIALGMKGVAWILQNMDISENSPQELKEIEEMLVQSIEKQKDYLRLYGPENSAKLAITLHNLAKFYQDTGKVDIAGDLFRESHDMKRVVFDGKPHISTAIGLTSLTRNLLLAGNIEEALEKAEEAMDIKREVLPESSEGYHLGLYYLIRIYTRLGNSGEVFKLKDELRKAVANPEDDKYFEMLDNIPDDGQNVLTVFPTDLTMWN